MTEEQADDLIKVLWIIEEHLERIARCAHPAERGGNVWNTTEGK